MDKHTRRELYKINMRAAMRYKKEMTRKTKIYEDDKARLKEMAKDRRLSPKQKDLLKRQIAEMEPLMDRESHNIDPKVTDKIDKEVEHEVNKAIKRGKIKEPKLTAWEKKRMSE